MLPAHTLLLVSKNDLQKILQLHQLHPLQVSHIHSFCQLSILLCKILHHSSNTLLILLSYHKQIVLNIYHHFSMYKFLNHVSDLQQTDLNIFNHFTNKVYQIRLLHHLSMFLHKDHHFCIDIFLGISHYF